MLALREGNRCLISLIGLAKRLNKSPRMAFTYVHELITSGYIAPIDPKNGCANRYMLKAFTSANGFSASGGLTGQPLQRLAATTANGFSGTVANGFSHPRDSIYIPREDDVEKKDRENEARQRLLEILAEQQANLKEAEKDVDWLLGRHPQSHAILIGHLRDAINTKHPKPVEYVDERTGRGEAPRLSYLGLMHGSNSPLGQANKAERVAENKGEDAK
jgi:hypothetical protein